MPETVGEAPIHPLMGHKLQITSRMRQVPLVVTAPTQTLSGGNGAVRWVSMRRLALQLCRLFSGKPHPSTHLKLGSDYFIFQSRFVDVVGTP